MLDEFEDGYEQFCKDHPYINDVDREAAFILGPQDSWGSEYYTVLEDVSCALCDIIRKGYLDESGTRQIARDGEDCDCMWLLTSVLNVGAELAEKWKKFRIE